MSLELPFQLFVALWALYSPLGALSSYFPFVSRMNPRDRAKLVVGLFSYVTIFGMSALWIGEPLLELLGVSADALTVTGGVALLSAGIPILRGSDQPVPKQEALTIQLEPVDWKAVLFMPVTFPLTVNGATFAFFVAARAEARTTPDVFALSVAALAYALVTAITLFASSHLERRVSWATRAFLHRLTGVVLVAMAATLLLSGGPRMVAKVLESRRDKPVPHFPEGEVK
jgi:multiple antibiotic resistance protein